MRDSRGRYGLGREVDQLVAEAKRALKYLDAETRYEGDELADAIRAATGEDDVTLKEGE
ncbi:hypothetical protein LCGC14_0698520 [marine sediment metagenome]|uniref:Uncharacterized protein n=1 Tax=marine sediment metagenome TaxID=412755 RepID=A0A0F9TR98_9ZZZZ